MCAEVPASSMILLLGTIWSTWEVKIFADLRSRSVVFHCVTSCFAHVPLAFSLIRGSRFGRNLSLSKLPGSMVSSVGISTLAGWHVHRLASVQILQICQTAKRHRRADRLSHRSVRFVRALGAKRAWQSCPEFSHVFLPAIT